MNPDVMTSSHPLMRMRRETFKTGFLSNAHDVTKEANEIQKAVAKGKVSCKVMYRAQLFERLYLGSTIVLGRGQ